MKLFAIIIFAVLGLSAQAQMSLEGGRKYRSSPTINGYGAVDLMVIQDMTDYSLSDFGVTGGLLIGRIGLEIGVYRQSDAIAVQENQNNWSHNYFYDCQCGIGYQYNQYSQSSNNDRFVYLNYMHAGLSITPVAKDGARLRVVPGIGRFSLHYPVVDTTASELEYASQLIAQKWVAHFGLDFAKQFRNNSMLFLKGFVFQDTELSFPDQIFPVVGAGYLVPVAQGERNVFLGVGASYRDHVWSGDEVGMRGIFQLGIGEKTPVIFRGFLGVSSNQSRGMRFEWGVSVGFDSLIQNFFSPL